MPFESKAQRSYMYANHPALAKEFEKATPKDAKLPAHVSDLPKDRRVAAMKKVASEGSSKDSSSSDSSSK